MENITHEPYLDPLWDDASATAATGASPTPARFDGWTPFARALFLTVLADTGRVSLACEYTQRSRQAAYALRARDPLFAASWDAACELARAPLADALYERALDGTTETITRDGQVVAERHRHDNRLSMAVLSRLDKRCDRAEERGAHHRALVQRWNDWIELIGKGEEQGAQLLLESAPGETAQHCQHCQLPLGETPMVKRPTTLEEWRKLHPLAAASQSDDADEDEQTIDLSDRCWKDNEGVWVTNFPPPADFDGFRIGTYGERGYERACTAEEAAILDADFEAEIEEGRIEDERLRDQWFAYLASEPDESDDDSDPQTAPADPDQLPVDGAPPDA